MKTLIHSLILLMVLPVLALSQTTEEDSEQKSFKNFWKKQVNTRMVSQLYTAYGVGDTEFQMVKLIVKPELKIKLHKNLRFIAMGRVYSELLDNLEPGRPDQGEVSAFSRQLLIGDRVEAELRELYFDWYVGKKSTLRLGKQQIVWGETDGLKLLDVVNPQNFREFMLEEFEDSRIPLWSVKAEFPIKKLDVEMVWIPDMSYHDIPDVDAPYFPNALIPQPPDGFQVNMLHANKPNTFLLDSDIGTKLSLFVKGWDLTLNYLYHFDDLTVMARSIDFNTGEAPLVSVQAKYNRLHTLGGTFNNVFGPVTLRGEVAYHFNRRFMTGDMNDSDGVVQSDQFMMAIGADWLFKETMLSIQVFSNVLINDIIVYNRKGYEPNFSFLATQEMMNDELKMELLIVQNLRYVDGMIRPKVSYQLLSNLKLIAGSDIFFGNEQQLFGQYNDQSRIFLGIEWGI